VVKKVSFQLLSELRWVCIATARKSSGKLFHAERPAWLNQRFPNFVRSRGSEKSVVEVERNPQGRI